MDADKSTIEETRESTLDEIIEELRERSRAERASFAEMERLKIESHIACERYHQAVQELLRYHAERAAQRARYGRWLPRVF